MGEALRRRQGNPVAGEAGGAKSTAGGEEKPPECSDECEEEIADCCKYADYAFCLGELNRSPRSTDSRFSSVCVSGCVVAENDEDIHTQCRDRRRKEGRRLERLENGL